MAKVKVFVHATDGDGRAMTLAPQTYLSRLAKNQGVFVKHYAPCGNKVKIQGRSQGHKVIDFGVDWKGIISGVCMPNIKSL